MLIITDGNSALLEAIWWHGPHAERISTFLINTLPLALVLSNVATFSIVAVIAIRHYTRKYR